MDSGDQVQSISGCFSGSLGFILTEMEDGSSLGDALVEAMKRGLTEPNPSEDLSGVDVARKALILARTIGYKWELEDIELEPLYQGKSHFRTIDELIQHLKGSTVVRQIQTGNKTKPDPSISCKRHTNKNRGRTRKGRP